MTSAAASYSFRFFFAVANRKYPATHQSTPGTEERWMLSASSPHESAVARRPYASVTKHTPRKVLVRFREMKSERDASTRKYKHARITT